MFHGLLDDETRAELLCYLVVSQIVALVLTEEWMRPEHLVESIRIWLNGSRAQAHWSERIYLGTLSEKVAADFTDRTRLPARIELTALFADFWQLDYRSPVVREIHAACEVQLSSDA